MGRTKPPYAPEFRAEAVRLARTSGQPLRATAEHLGVSVEALRGWVKQGAVDAGERDGLTSEEREELRRLRRENCVFRLFPISRSDGMRSVVPTNAISDSDESDQSVMGVSAAVA